MDWNPWHGCHKLSAGCQNCYVYRSDAKFQRDSSVVVKTGDFYRPLKRDRKGNYKLEPGKTVYTCFTSDFFVEDADPWRAEAWQMMKARKDLTFFFITKRIHRFYDCIPADWGEGYRNVHICCTVENQDRADFRLPIFLKAPIAKKSVACAPLLEEINLLPYLGPQILEVAAGGESGPAARVCNYDWILSIRRQCIEKNVPFHFQQTGARFQKDGRLYQVKRQFQRSQARKAGIDWRPAEDGNRLER